MQMRVLVTKGHLEVNPVLCVPCSNGKLVVKQGWDQIIYRAWSQVNGAEADFSKLT